MSTNRKPRAAASNRAAILANLVSAIWQGVTARDAAIAAYAAAGVEDEDTKNYVMRTYMARRLYPAATECTPAMLTEAQRVLALPGATSKHVEKRTQEQEKFCTGARQYLFAIRKAAGVEASDTRGGANNTGTREPRTPDGDIPIAPPGATAGAAPKAGPRKFETEVDFRAHMFQVATVIGQMAKNNASVLGMQTNKVVARWIKDTLAWAPTPAK